MPSGVVVRAGRPLSAVVMLLLTSLEAAVHNSCYLNNGHCRYEVRVASECDRRSLTNQLLNNPRDDDWRRQTSYNDIEHYLQEAKAEQSQRLASLENKLDTFASLLTSATNPQPKSLPVTKDDGNTSKLKPRSDRKRRIQNSAGFQKDPGRKENQLLNKIHKEFSRLRQELGQTSKQLADTTGQLATARQQLNDSDVTLSRTKAQLRDTERKLEEEQAVGYQTRKQLADTQAQLNTTQVQLEAARKEARRMRVELWRARSEADDCKERLQECLADAETLRRALEQALVKYHELNLRHENVTLILNDTREQLITCYREKTTWFCGFEDPLICGFQQISTGGDILDWLHWQSDTPSRRTGPSIDHTCQNDKGHYMYVEATKRAKGDLAKLVSPRYHGYGEMCVEFYYHMFGYHVGTLKVYTMVPGQDVVPMWRAFGNQGNVWTTAKISIPPEEASTGFQVVFEASIGRGNEGDIAIDDVRVTDGSCYVTNTHDDVTTPKSTSSQNKHKTTNKQTQQ